MFIRILFEKTKSPRAMQIITPAFLRALETFMFPRAMKTTYVDSTTADDLIRALRYSVSEIPSLLEALISFGCTRLLNQFVTPTSNPVSVTFASIYLVSEVAASGLHSKPIPFRRL